MDAVSSFSKSITNEVQQIREKIISDIEKFKQRVTNAIEGVYQKFSNTSNALNDCVEVSMNLSTHHFFSRLFAN